MALAFLALATRHSCVVFSIQIALLTRPRMNLAFLTASLEGRIDFFVICGNVPQLARESRGLNYGNGIIYIEANRVLTYFENMKNKYCLKEAAHQQVAKAIRKGEILKQPCIKCGLKAVAHHPDYSKPLEVIWLCKAHHGFEHRKMTNPHAIFDVISKQVRWQRKRRAAGLCGICGKRPAIDGFRCLVHIKANRKCKRNIYRKEHGQPLDNPISPQGRRRIY